MKQIIIKKMLLLFNNKPEPLAEKIYKVHCPTRETEKF